MSRELDAKIAEQVMGWTLSKPEVAPGSPVSWGRLTRTWLTAEGTPTRQSDESWTPSTDIAAAWQVVERILTLGKHFDIHRFRDDSGWWVSFDSDNSSGVIAPSAPEAICNAALAAVGAPRASR